MYTGYRGKKEQREIESIKLAAAKQYALMRYFNKIERLLRQSKIENLGFRIVSLTEDGDWANLIIMTTQYKDKQKVEVPYSLDVKIKSEDGKQRYYFKLEEIDHETYRCHFDIYALNQPVGQTGASQ